MALPFGVSWLCLLLWSCICFLPQRGCSTVRGYSSPQLSSQFNHEDSLKNSYEDETRTMRQQSFASHHREPESSENRNHVGSVGSLGEEWMRSQPDSVLEADKFSLTFTDNSENEVWSRPGANHQNFDESHTFPDPADSPENLISFSTYGNQVLIPQSDLNPYNNLVPTEMVSNDITSRGLPRGNDLIFTINSNNEPIESSNNQLEQIQFLVVSPVGEDSFCDCKIVSPDKHPNHVSEDFRRFSKETSSSTPLAYKWKAQKPKHLKDFSEGQMSSDTFEHHRGTHKVTQAGVLSQQKPSSNSFLQRRQFFIPNSVPKYRKKAGPSFQTHLSSVGKKSKALYSNPTIHQPVSRDSALSSKSIMLQKAGRTGLQTRVRHKPQKQRDRSHLVFSVKPPSSSHSSSRHTGYLEVDRVQIDPSILTPHVDENSAFKQNLVSALQEPNESAITKHGDMKSTQMGITSSGAKNQLSSLSAQDQFLLLNGGYEDAITAGLLKPSNQPLNPQILPDVINKRPTNLASLPSGLLPEPKGSDCVVWRTAKSSLPEKSQKFSLSSANSYIASKNRSARATAYLLKMCYTPNQQVHRMKAKHQRKLAIRRRIKKAPPHNAKGLEKW